MKNTKSKKIKSILVANRGEIAIRIMKTARNMNIRTIAVYSNVDKNAHFLSFADEAVFIEGNTSKESYLDIEKIIQACKISGADAVHPGYGFLSEKEEFAKRLNKEKITFIGPSAESMGMMGDKITSKQIAKKAGVNVIPGFIGSISTQKEAMKIATEIGFPIIIKASAGGGGKGMKIVYNKDELMGSIESAKNEARNAFNDDTIFIEKYIEKPHHIEVQIIADKHGNVVCLGERECSIQRFNQKIIEESPSPFVDERTRLKLYDQSIKLAKMCKYYSAGTIEYVMDKHKNFYFLEMNTRLQVEHPVTEFVTKKDLVSLMIKIANGEKLTFSQKDIKLEGSAIECRVCAEDPSKNFMPSIGRIEYYKEPQFIQDINFRIDSGVTEGSEISQYYDSMISKVIVHSDTRKSSIEGMKKVLGEYQLQGISTNINFLEDIIRNETFTKGIVSTWFIKEQYPNGFKTDQINDYICENITVSALKYYIEKESKNWMIQNNDFKKSIKNIDQSLTIQINDLIYDVKYHITEQNEISMSIDNKSLLYKSNYQNGDMIILGVIDNKEYSFVKIIKKTPLGFVCSSAGMIVNVEILPKNIAEYKKYMPHNTNNIIPSSFKAPISGIITKIFVKKGMIVLAGQELLAIEAMKMENIIRSDFDVKIKDVFKSEGEMISVGDKIIEFER